MKIVTFTVHRRKGRGFARLFSGLGFAMLCAKPALATPPVAVAPSQAAGTNEVAPSAGFLNGISRRSYLLDDMWGARPWLSRYGLSLNILETSEVLGNVSGGARQGFEYDGLTQMILQMDTKRAFDLYGGTFNVSALQIHGRNLSSDNLYSLQTASGIESDRATRLWELWYQQQFDQSGWFDLKIGQQSLDQEFMVSQNALVFVNTMFGWPMVPSADLPGGGPAYPLSALGARGRVRLGNSWTLLAGVFNGSPVADNSGDPQRQNSSGTSFPLNGGALVIGELQYAYPAMGTMVYADQQAPLSRVYKLGAWYDSESFADQQRDNRGLSLASPSSMGAAQMHRGNFALYAVADQMIWQDSLEADRSLNVFIRPMGTVLADRNLIDFSLNAGITFQEPFIRRDNDTFGIGMGYTHVSGRAAALDRDTGFFTGSSFPVRSGEAFVEVTYQYQLAPWCTLQPDFQYIFNPGGGVANPNSATGQRIKDEAILGMRVNIAF